MERGDLTNEFECFTDYDYIAQYTAEMGAKQGGVMMGQFLYASGTAVISHGHGAPHGNGHVEAVKKHDDVYPSGFCDEHGRA
jgi:hypothetical protein